MSYKGYLYKVLKVIIRFRCKGIFMSYKGYL
jgi:hypothetical protein